MPLLDRIKARKHLLHGLAEVRLICLLLLQSSDYRLNVIVHHMPSVKHRPPKTIQTKHIQTSIVYLTPRQTANPETENRPLFHRWKCACIRCIIELIKRDTA
jgi:hypothetical protein